MDLIILKLVFTLIAAFIGYQIYRAWQIRHWDETQPQRQLTVSVVEKRSLMQAVPHVESPTMANVTSDTTDTTDGVTNYYYVTFEPIAGGPPQEFQVNQRFYERAKKGTCGTIQFQGSRFIDFVS
jgi:hypothetical protein